MRRTKKESPEELREKDEAKKKSDIKDALTQAKFAGKPTYYFPVGAKWFMGPGRKRLCWKSLKTALYMS